MGLFRCLIVVAFIFAVPIALLTTNIRIAVTHQRVYDYSVRHYGAARVSAIAESELLRANSEIKRYLTADDPGPLAITVSDDAGDESSLFNARETAHMADVRDLVQMLFTTHALALASLLTLAVGMLVVWPPRALIAAACCGGILTASAVGLAGIVALAGFDSAWSQLHTITFANDFWQLDPDRDRLIQMFPEAFWQRISLALGFITVLQAVAISGGCAVSLVLTRPITEPNPELLTPAIAGPARPHLAPPAPRHSPR